MEGKKEIPLKFTIEINGDIICNVTKEQFNEIQKEKIQPKKIVFEIE